MIKFLSLIPKHRSLISNTYWRVRTKSFTTITKNVSTISCAFTTLKSFYLIDNQLNDFGQSQSKDTLYDLNA